MKHFSKEEVNSKKTVAYIPTEALTEMLTDAR
jgi:hypothetical protein